MKISDKGITFPKGFEAAAVCAGLRGKTDKNDMALILCKGGATAAGVFTKNKVKAAPVLWDKQVLASGNKIKAVIINSRIANACTGDEGFENAKASAKKAAEILACKPEEVLISSTGVIGMQLEREVILKGTEKLFEKTSDSEQASAEAAEAIMTTDTKKKVVSAEVELGGKKVRFGGMCKGSGMIHPNLGTMLSYITCDANISQPLLEKALREVCEKTFNMVSVDGDTSTNDTLIVLSNGLAENEIIECENGDYIIFRNTLFELCRCLARKIAEDGEGATKLMEVNVKNARTYEDAVLISKSVACSSLTKSAVFGSDANWGRIICAMGYSEGSFNPYNADISIESEKGTLKLVENGMGAGYDEEKATDILSGGEVKINIDLKEGEGAATAWGCDLTYDYVKINADYRS